MDRLLCHGQTSELLQIFPVTSNSNFSCYVILNCSWYVKFYSVALFVKLNSSVQFCSESAQLRQLVSSILQRACSTPSVSQLNSAAKPAHLRQRVLSYLHTYCVKSPSVSGSFHLHTPWRVPLFCILHSVQERPLYHVLRVFSTMSTLDSVLLCNSEILYRIVILWLCTA